MKKARLLSLLVLLMTAATGAWAQIHDVLFLVGGGTAAGLSDGDPRSPGAMMKVDDFNWVWYGRLTTGDGDNGALKLSTQESGWDGGYYATSAWQSLEPGVEYKLTRDNTDDRKFSIAQDGLYKVTVSTRPGTIRADLLTGSLTQEDGYYLIGSLDDYFLFAATISAMDTEGVKARLTADLDFSANTFYPLANDKYKFKGEFDGAGHTIRGINIIGEYNNIGFVRWATSGAHIHDLVIEGSIEGKSKVAGFIGHVRDGGTAKLTNVVNKATIKAKGNNDANAAAFFAFVVNNYGGTKVEALNCVNAGSVSGQAGQCGAFSGWAQNGSTFTNCINLGAISGMEGTKQLYRGEGNITLDNCYDFTHSGSQGILGDPTTLLTGEFCYQLNDGQSTTVWYQTIGIDAYPYPIATGHEEVIYSNGNCSNLFTVTLADGTTEADKWTIDPAEAATTGVANSTEVNLSYGGRLKVRGVTAEVYPLTTPLTLEAQTDGTIVVNDPKDGMYYTLNGGEKTAMTGTTTINVATGDKVQFYGTAAMYEGTRIADGTADVIVYGNIMSLVDDINYATATKLTEIGAFSDLFCGLDNQNGNDQLKDASGLLLPATTLSIKCYERMFGHCTNLTAAPELPATTLAPGCYRLMFIDCHSLTVAPMLPATRLARVCYDMMFEGCTSLTTAPVLPAEKLEFGCYDNMFSFCSKLNEVTCLATDLGNSSTTGWLSNVAFSGTFITPRDTRWGTGDDGVPFFWQYEDYVKPELTLTNPAVGQIIGSDGKNYVAGALPTGVFAVAKICYVNGNNGLALAMEDEIPTAFNWQTGNYDIQSTTSWSSALQEVSHHVQLFSNGTWKIPSKEDWDNMMNVAGAENLRYGFRNIGGTNLEADAYWSTTESNGSEMYVYNFTQCYWGSSDKNDQNRLRLCFEF